VVQLAGSLYMLSTVLFGVIALVIGMRLVRLSSRTGQPAERWLGLGVMLTAGFGYMVMMFSLIFREAAGDAVGRVLTGSLAFGWICHNLGVLCMLRFIVVVFRPREAWARWLALAMSTVLWVGWAGYLLQGGLRATSPTGMYWVAFTAIGGYPLWSGTEALLYYRRMRRQLALGIADPLVANRFLLWSLASYSAAASIWCVNLPSLMGERMSTGSAGQVTVVSMLVTALFGITTVCIYWLTFFPPAWYRRRFARATASEEKA
jgi:hypothetical protein